MKLCTKCKQIRTLENFYLRKEGNRRSFCKSCISQDRRKYYEKNKEDIIKQKKNYREENREKISIKHKQYYVKNKHEILKRCQTYAKKRKLIDPIFKLSCNLRRRFRSALKNNKKQNSTIKDLGCSLTIFKNHLESKFQIGMTWENYGKWHLDHIIPLSSFDLSKKEEFLKACHYTNLQPLWAMDNLRKSNRINFK